jgi:hypothetical protein
MDEKKIEQEQEQPIVEKRAYTPPTLSIYGKLTELTASGTGMEMENMSQMTPDRFP